MTNLRRKDTTKGPPLRILSLDGGGVRGYSMLIILETLMHRSFVEVYGRPPRPDEKLKPCDYFDLIAGTGTGGLIAIMLGRLRLDLETCKKVYSRMARHVFETDKTWAGVPYRKTFFKASKLEEAIRECVREHTVSEEEGNDGTATGGHEFQTMSPTSPVSALPQRTASVYSSLSQDSAKSLRNSIYGIRFGNPNASLYDGRENRTKTAVTAVFKGTPKNGHPILLRSYDSRKEPPPEFNCTIWEAGRATSATGMAFKPIQIGKSMFLDEGQGNFNPAPQILAEAAVNEWPGRDIGIFVSIGTGKRPGGTSKKQVEWYEGLLGTMGNFAEARRRLAQKIEDCETTHQQMLSSTLQKYGVPIENYCRLNVEVGVGDFGMNEWDRLTEISTGTNLYLQTPEVERMIQQAAAKIGKIELTKRRLEGQGRYISRGDPTGKSLPPPPSNPDAVELPGEDVPPPSPISTHYTPRTSTIHPPYPYASSQDRFMVLPSDIDQPRASAEMPYRHSGEFSYDSPYNISPRRSGEDYRGPEPPPIPPKTPIYGDGGLRPPQSRMSTSNPKLPYPDFDPPIVNKLRKPKYNPG